MRATVLLILVAFANCTSTKPLADQTFTKERLTEQLDMEDRIAVLKKDGEQYRLLKVDAIEEDYLLCHNSKYENLIIYYSTIQNIKIEYHDTGKTIGAILGVALGTLAVAMILTLVSGRWFE